MGQYIKLAPEDYRKAKVVKSNIITDWKSEIVSRNSIQHY